MFIFISLVHKLNLIDIGQLYPVFYFQNFIFIESGTIRFYYKLFYKSNQRLFMAVGNGLKSERGTSKFESKIVFIFYFVALEASLQSGSTDSLVNVKEREET